MSPADNFIKTTYSLAQGRNYNHDWVNCQYARLLIETSGDLTDKQERIQRLKSAHALIIGQENRHYPFRVACKYFDFLDENEKDIDLDTKKTLAGFLREFDAKYHKTKSQMHNQNHPVMEEFKRRCRAFLESIQPYDGAIKGLILNFELFQLKAQLIDCAFVVFLSLYMFIYMHI
ncbi:hypothetical protein LNO81_02280 [Klebsiella variicola subsp. variicola]|nr:hypothetical protein [Klebsiella variicola subsp. variicola]